MNAATRKLINEIYLRTHEHCYDGAAAGNFLREVMQALSATQPVLAGYALRNEESGHFGSLLYPNEHWAMLAKQETTCYSGPHPLYTCAA